jgi:hypothetical protein
LRALAADIVDWKALGDVVLASLVAGVGTTVAYSFAIFGMTRFAEMRRDGRVLEATAFAVLGVAGLVATIGAIVVGIVVMTSKS